MIERQTHEALLANAATIKALRSFRIEPEYDWDVRDAAAVIGAPFNRYLKRQPADRSNCGIVQIAASHMRYFDDLPYFGQWEQTNLLRAEFGDRVCEYPDVHGCGEWVQTHVLIKWIAEEVLKLGRGNKVILVGHPHHVCRVAILAQHYGLNPIVVPACAHIAYDHNWCRRGVQLWCTWPVFYIPWEYASRQMLIRMIQQGKI
ncbi:MAG: hypothetical protein WCI89_02965 [bacterium]